MEDSGQEHSRAVGGKAYLISFFPFHRDIDRRPSLFLALDLALDIGFSRDLLFVSSRRRSAAAHVFSIL